MPGWPFARDGGGPDRSDADDRPGPACAPVAGRGPAAAARPGAHHRGAPVAAAADMDAVRLVRPRHGYGLDRRLAVAPGAGTARREPAGGPERRHARGL